jgi:hypothetical protein
MDSLFLEPVPSHSVLVSHGVRTLDGGEHTLAREVVVDTAGVEHLRNAYRMVSFLPYDLLEVCTW